MASPIDIIKEQPVIGMFGTCGPTTFRQDLLIPEYQRQGIRYFNPQVENWDPSLAEIEADHLAYDAVQLWPVTRDTYGTGSLAETGYSLAASLAKQNPWPKFVLTMIEQELADHLTDEVARQESLRARRLVAAHLAKSDADTLIPVHSLPEMLDKSVVLYRAAEMLVDAARTSERYRRFVERFGDSAVAEAMRSGFLGTEAAAIQRSIDER